MAQVRLLGGKPLLVDGKVALSDSCCCEVTPPVVCELPDGDCPHAICFELNLDADDTSDRDFIELDQSVSMYYDGNWQIYGQSGSESLAPSGTVFGVWHSFVIQITRIDDTTTHIEWSVDGVSGTGFDDVTGSSFTSSNIIFGAINGSGNAHRSLRNIFVVSNPDTSEEDFSFPPDSFDSFSGGASIVGGELRIDDIVGDAYAEKDFDPAYNLACAPCCDRDITEISTIDVTLSIDATFADATCGTGSLSNMFSWNFTRIDKVTPFTPGNNEFKFYLGPNSGSCCALTFLANDNAALVLSHTWAKEHNICEDGDFRFPGFHVTFDDSCDIGTLNLKGDNIIGLVEAIYGGIDEACNDAVCSASSSSTGFSDLADGISVTTCDFSNLIGSYTLSNTTIGGSTITIKVTVNLVFS